MFEYARVVCSYDTSQIVTWLLENAVKMDKTIFYSTKFNWNEMFPERILVLRAMAPSGVFIEAYEGGFLQKVSNNQELVKLSNILFKDDYQFANGVESDIKAQIIALMRMAYTNKIRTADSRVKQM